MHGTHIETTSIKIEDVVFKYYLENKKPTSPDKTNWFEFRKKLNGT